MLHKFIQVVAVVGLFLFMLLVVVSSTAYGQYLDASGNPPSALISNPNLNPPQYRPPQQVPLSRPGMFVSLRLAWENWICAVIGYCRPA